MRKLFPFGLLLLVALLGPAGPARSADQILVAGDPPLTRDLVAHEIGRWELFLDIKLSAAQRQQFEQLRVASWNRKPQASKDEYSKRYTARADAAQPGKPGGKQNREEQQQRSLAVLRAANEARFYETPKMLEQCHVEAARRLESPEFEWSHNDAFARFLLSIYDTAVLVPGNPPLTRGIFDNQIIQDEWLLDMPLTPAQRNEFRQCFIAAWKKQSKEKQAAVAKRTEELSVRLAKWPHVEALAARVKLQPAALKVLRASKDADDKWLLAAYEAAHKPGGDRNPVLIEGAPPLTQDLINEYTDFFEWRFAQTMMGGWPDKHLQQLQRMIADDWRAADSAGRDAILADLKWWHEVYPTLTGREFHDARNRKPHYEVHVRSAATTDKERARWLQDLDNRTECETQLILKYLDTKHQMNMTIINNMRSNYEWRSEYNSRTGRHEWRQVEKR